MIIQKKQLAIAMSLAGVLGLGASVVHAVDFTASATVENTVTVTNLQDFDLGTLFATASGTALSDGVGAVKIGPDGSVADVGSTTVQLISLSTPTPGQGSVDVASNFTLEFPATDTITEADFLINAGVSLINITNGTTGAIQLENQAAIGNPAVASLYLVHFTVGDVSGGTVGTENDGTALTATPNGGFFPVVMDFGAPTYVFNIGGTVVTEPTTSATNYETGTYSGTFEVLAAY